MWIVEHRARLLWFGAPGSTADTVVLPDDTLAVGLAVGRACALARDGSVWDVDRTGPRLRRRLILPEGVTHAAISGDGELVVVAVNAHDEPWTDRPCGILRSAVGEWTPVSSPEFLCAVTDLRCAPDGRGFAYVYRSSQPWSENGSYGDPRYGGVVLDVDGRPIRESWEVRGIDDHRSRRLPAWGPGGDPLVLVTGGDATERDDGVTEVLGGGQPRSDGQPWNHGPGGAPPYVGEELVVWFGGEATTAAVSPDGSLVAAAADGVVHLLDWRWNAGREIAVDAIALRLDEDVLDVVTTEGEWRQLPVDEEGWETRSE